MFLSLATSSGYNLLVLSTERYMAITKPLSYNEQTIKRKLFIIIPAIWLSGFIFVFPDPFLFVIRDGVCIYKVGSWSKTYALLTYAYYACSNFVVPGGIMLILYTHMGVVIWRGAKLQKQMIVSNSKNDTLGKAQMNIFFTCVILLCLYVTCWLWNELHTILYIGEVIEFSEPLYHVSAIFILFNSVINPFIYTIRYTEFQMHIRLLFCKYHTKNSLTSENVISTVIWMCE